MRDKNFDVDLLKTLNDQPMPETPLTDDEFTRVLDAACGQAAAEKARRHRRFPWERWPQPPRPVWPWGWAASTLPRPLWPSSCP